MDGIDRFAAILVALGALSFVWGTLLMPPSSLNDAVATHYSDWAPGLLTDGMLLLVVNAILRRHERRRVLSQVGSLSREFALDAVRRARTEGWLADGSMAGMDLNRASLSGADLSEASLRGVDLSFSDLRSVTLAYARLDGATLTGADLREADLRWSDLRGADLQWADLRGAMLDGALMDGVDARYAAVDASVAPRPVFAGAIPGGFLDDEQIREVRRTLDLLLDAGPRPIEAFYERLFVQAPETRSMFSSDPRIQARKFLQSLKVIVAGLHAPQRHVTVLQRLGERHDGYGVRPEHYGVVGSTLISVLADALGPAFTPEARAAWHRAFDLMASVMTGGAARGSKVGAPTTAASATAA